MDASLRAAAKEYEECVRETAVPEVLLHLARVHKLMGLSDKAAASAAKAAGTPLAQSRLIRAYIAKFARAGAGLSSASTGQNRQHNCFASALLLTFACGAFEPSEQPSLPTQSVQPRPSTSCRCPCQLSSSSR